MEKELKEKLAKANAENRGIVVYPEYFKKRMKKFNPEFVSVLEATAKSEFTHVDEYGVYKTGTFLHKNCIVTVLQDEGLFALQILADNAPIGLPLIKEIRYKYLPDNLLMAQTFGRRAEESKLKGVVLYQIPNNEEEPEEE